MSKNKLSVSPKHIVCLVTNDLVTDQRMQRICTTLADAGYRVTIVGRLLPNSPPLAAVNFNQVRLKCPYNKGFLFYSVYNLRLMFWLIFNRFSIVCAIDLDTIIPAWLVSKLKNKPLVYDAHEWFPECPEIVVRPKVYSFWNSIEKIFVPKAAAAYTVSSCIAAILSKKYNISFGLVRNMPLYQQTSGKDQKGYILYQGALNIGRGIEQMILAMPYIDRELWLAGSGDIELELQQLVADHHLSDKVKFLGRLNPQSLLDITRESWLGINLLENLSLNYYYSLANKFFDYVQVGIPQISMNFPEYAGLNQQFEVACLLNQLTSEDIVKAIQRFEKEEGYYQRLQANCKLAAKEWTWENESKQLLAVYASLEG